MQAHKTVWVPPERVCLVFSLTPGKLFGGSSESYTELPCDPAVPLWGAHPKELKGTQTDTCTPMFTAALVTRAKGGNNASVLTQMNG